MLFAAARDVQKARRRTTFTTARVGHAPPRCSGPLWQNGVRARSVRGPHLVGGSSPASVKGTHPRSLSDPPTSDPAGHTFLQAVPGGAGEKENKRRVVMPLSGLVGTHRHRLHRTPRQRARGRHEIETGARVPPFPKCHTRVPPLQSLSSLRFQEH
ncbi:hypothetical protein MTO96_016692 [Rhipicephalus appendiculatus]